MPSTIQHPASAIDDDIFDPSTHVYVPIKELEHVLEAAEVHGRFDYSVAVLRNAINHGEPFMSKDDYWGQRFKVFMHEPMATLEPVV